MKVSRQNLGTLVSALALSLINLPPALAADAPAPSAAPAKFATPCAANPCAGAKRRSRGDNPCAGNPCAGQRRRGNADEANPCAGKSRRRSSDNPCAGKSR